MSWIQENKFIAGLAGVTALIGGAILYFGSSQGGKYEAQIGEFEDLKRQHSQLVKAKPYPDAKNLKLREENVNQYKQVIVDVRQALIGYQPGELQQLTPQEFSDVRVKMQNDLRAAFIQAGTELPEDCEFGFEKYADKQAKASATARLNFELGALQWLLTRLAEVKPQELINIRRSELAVEKGVIPAAPEPQRRGKRQRGARKAQASAEVKPFVMMPVELSFTASESSLREFLKEMANSDKYYYAIRAIRIRNEKQTAPTVKDANFKAGAAAPADLDPFVGIPLPDEEPAEEPGDDQEAPAPVPAPKLGGDGERILKQVLGSEKLDVHISFDILLIKGEEDSAETPTDARGNTNQ